MYWTPDKMLFLADVDEYSFTNAVTQPFVQAQIKENIKAPRRWPLWREFTGDRWIRGTRGL